MSVMQVLLHRFFAYRPCKPRSTLLRIGLGLVGLAVLALLVVFGLFIGLGMLVFAAVRRLMGRRPLSAEATPPDVINGEYTVVTKRTASIGLH